MLYFMRHGETNYNVLGLCNDDPHDDVRLTERGKAQARAAAAKLLNAQLARIVVSPLPRTRETADIVNATHCAPIVVEPDIIDWKTGLNGKPVAELFARIAADPLHTRIGDGESLLDHKQRVWNFLERFVPTVHETTLVVAHEETLRVATAYFNGLSNEAMRALHYDNCAILSFDVAQHTHSVRTR